MPCWFVEDFRESGTETVVVFDSFRQYMVVGQNNRQEILVVHILSDTFHQCIRGDAHDCRGGQMFQKKQSVVSAFVHYISFCVFAIVGIF